MHIATSEYHFKITEKLIQFGLVLSIFIS